MQLKPGQKSAFYGEKGMRLVRSWKILLLLAESSEPLPVPEIHRRIHQDPDFINNECAIQTIREDLKALQKTGFPIQAINSQGEPIPSDEESVGRGVHKNLRWRFCEPTALGDFTNPRHNMPTATDVLNLSLCRSLLAMDVPSRYPLFPMLQKMLEELHCRMNRSLRRGELAVQDLMPRVLHLGKRYLGSSTEKDNWDTFASAIGKRQVLSGNYRNRNEQSGKPVNIAPLALWIEEGRSYVLGAGGRDHVIRSWRVDRFSDLVMANALDFPDIEDEVIEKKLKESFRGYISDPIEIQLTVRPEIAYLFREYVYHPTQNVVELADGGIKVELTCPLSWGIEEWVLGFGELVTIERPIDLRQSILRRVQKMLNNYPEK